MLNLVMNNSEYLQIGKDVRILFEWSGENKTRISVDAPREVYVARSKLLKRIVGDRAANGDADSIAIKNELEERDVQYSKEIAVKKQKRDANMKNSKKRARAMKLADTQASQSTAN